MDEPKDSQESKLNSESPPKLPSEEEVDSALDKLKIPPDQRKVLKEWFPPVFSELRNISIKYFYSGQLPHPDLLDRFNDLIPNGADRIMKMAEKGLEMDSIEQHYRCQPILNY